MKSVIYLLLCKKVMMRTEITINRKNLTKLKCLFHYDNIT